MGWPWDKEGKPRPIMPSLLRLSREESLVARIKTWPVACASSEKVKVSELNTPSTSPWA